MLQKYNKIDDIVDIAISGEGLAMDKDTMTLCACTGLGCVDCYFSTKNYPNSGIDCRHNIKNWLNTKCKETKNFSNDERKVLELFDNINWLARDKDGTLYGYIEEPFRYGDEWESYDICVRIDRFTSLKFSSIKSTDERPTSREEILGGDK